MFYSYQNFYIITTDKYNKKMDVITTIIINKLNLKYRLEDYKINNRNDKKRAYQNLKRAE